MATSLCCRLDEDRNFAHYNFVNEQNNEAQALKDRISQVNVFLFFDSVFDCRSWLPFYYLLAFLLSLSE